MLSPDKLLSILSDEFGGVGEAMLFNDNEGICYACGNIQYGVEPDARSYRCDECGKNAVFGIEETLITLL